jgi:hypothetical protein
METRPGLLYGAEVLTYSKQWLRELEVTQNKIGRWILGVSPTASSAGVRAELGWVSVQNEIARRKLLFFGRVLNMPLTRWPRLVLQDMLEGSFSSKWFTETQAVVAEYGPVTWTGAWRAAIIKRWWAVQELEWAMIRASDSNLRFCPKVALRPRAAYIAKTAKSQLLSKFRLNDVLGHNKTAWCSVCQMLGNPVQHILVDCGGLSLIRVRFGLDTRIQSVASRNQDYILLIRDLLSSLQYMDAIKALFDKWSSFSRA